MQENMLTDADLVMTGAESAPVDADAAQKAAVEWKEVIDGVEKSAEPDPQDGMESADDEDTKPLTQKDVQTAYAYELAESAPENVVKRLIGRLTEGEKATGLKVKGNAFLITWSNNFKDRDHELFTEKAINAYVARVDMGIVPPPEVWVWHAGKNVRIGQANMVGYHDHFLLAVGEFDPTKQAQNAKAYYAKHQRQTGVSHGFVYPAEKFDGESYHEFNTFEISLLPKAVAANPFTNLEQVKELTTMALDDKKRQYIKDVFGDEADRVLDTLTESGKALEEMQHAFKDFASPSEGDSTTVSEAAVKEASTDLKALIPDLLEGQSEVFRINAAILSELKTARQQNADLLKRVEHVEAGQRAIKSDLPRMASTDEETRIKEGAIPVEMKNSMATVDPAAKAVFGSLVSE